MANANYLTLEISNLTLQERLKDPTIADLPHLLLFSIKIFIENQPIAEVSVKFLPGFLGWKYCPAYLRTPI